MDGPAQTRAIVDGVLYGCDAQVAVWVNERLGLGAVEVPFRAFGILPEAIVDGEAAEDMPKRLIGGAYFYNWVSTPGRRDIYCAVAVDDIGAGRIPVIQRILQFPFGELDLPRISAEISLSNERAVRQAKNLGFVLEGRKKHIADDGSEWGQFGLYRATCEFWKRRR